MWRLHSGVLSSVESHRKVESRANPSFVLALFASAGGPGKPRQGGIKDVHLDQDGFWNGFKCFAITEGDTFVFW